MRSAGPRPRVVLAPDSFKGTATAREAAEALGRGWRSARDADGLVAVPLADGGEGTLDALAHLPGAEWRRTTAAGPDGEARETEWLHLPGGVLAGAEPGRDADPHADAEAPGRARGATAVVELATVCGLTLLDAPRPLAGTSRGLGEVIRAALDDGVDTLVIGLGGSASTDGGAGMLAALGARLADEHGMPLPDGGGALERLAHVDLSDLAPPPAGGVIVLADVTAPLTGPTGAAAVFGPQKGASSAEVRVLDDALARLAALTPRAADPASPGAGAAGGVGWALATWGARLVDGASEIARLAGLDHALDGAAAVVTGEGRFDAQSATGKLPWRVARLAAARGVPCVLVAGVIEDGAETDAFADVLSLTDLVGSGRAQADPLAALERAGRELAERGDALLGDRA